MGDPEKAVFVREPVVLGSAVHLLASSDPKEGDSAEICALDIDDGAYQWTIPLDVGLTNIPAAPVMTTDSVCVATYRAVYSVGP
jgi:hypothetical protein